MSNSLQTHRLQDTRLPWPVLSPRVCSNSCPLSLWCYLTISFSATPSFVFCLQSFAKGIEYWTINEEQWHTITTQQKSNQQTTSTMLLKVLQMCYGKVLWPTQHIKCFLVLTYFREPMFNWKILEIRKHIND